MPPAQQTDAAPALSPESARADVDAAFATIVGRTAAEVGQALVEPSHTERTLGEVATPIAYEPLNPKNPDRPVPGIIRPGDPVRPQTPRTPGRPTSVELEYLSPIHELSSVMTGAAHRILAARNAATASNQEFTFAA